MNFDDKLASRVRKALAGHHASEIRMMGGLCFIVAGYMCVGIDRDRLIARVGRDAYPREVRRRHAGPFELTGRPMRGFILVAAGSVSTARATRVWVDRALAYVNSLPTQRRRKRRSPK